MFHSDIAKILKQLVSVSKNSLFVDEAIFSLDFDEKRHNFKALKCLKCKSRLSIDENLL